MNPHREQSTPLPDPDILDQMDVHIVQVATLRAALDLGVWAKVAAGEDTAERIASSDHWDPLGTRMLLDDLCAMRLLAREGDRYCLVPAAESYLLPDRPTYMGRYLLSEFGWEGNGRLAEAIRTGKRPIGYRATTPQAIDTWIGVYARSWADPEAFLGRCVAMWQELGIEPRDGMQVLDVACGPAPKSLALARANPGVHITLLDWEKILAVAGELASGLGVQAQVTCLPGDLWTVAFPAARFDVIYMGNITHFFSPEQNTLLFEKSYAALAEAGCLVINAARREKIDPMSPTLWFFAVSEGGAAYDFSEYKQMLSRAGFADIQDVRAQPIKATKRN